jgi:hypothetical protein
MTDSKFTHPRMTAQTIAGSPPVPSPIANRYWLRDTCGARLGLHRPRGHVNSDSII